VSKFIKASGRVLIVLLAAAIVGFSLFAAMQLVVHPLMGPPRRQQLSEGQRPAAQEGQPGPRQQENGEGRPPSRIRLRTLAGLAARVFLFGAVTLGVVVMQKLFFIKPRRPSPRA